MPSLMLVPIAVSEELKQTDRQNCALHIRFKNEKDFQIYIMLVKNFYGGGPYLAVASFISARCDTDTI